MFDVEKGKDKQGLISVALVASLFLNWFNVMSQGVGYGNKASAYGIFIGFELIIFNIIILCAFASTYISFTQPSSFKKSKWLALLATLSILTSIHIKGYYLAGVNGHTASIGFYLSIGLCISQFIIFYNEVIHRIKAAKDLVGDSENNVAIADNIEGIKPQMFNLDKGKNLQGIIVMLVLASLLIKWGEIAKIDAYGDSKAQGIYIMQMVDMFKVFKLAILSTIVAMWVIFTEEVGAIKNIKLGVLSTITLIVSVLIKIYDMLLNVNQYGYSYKMTVVVYLTMLLCSYHSYIMYLEIKKIS